MYKVYHSLLKASRHGKNNNKQERIDELNQTNIRSQESILDMVKTYLIGSKNQTNDE